MLSAHAAIEGQRRLPPGQVTVGVALGADTGGQAADVLGRKSSECLQELVGLHVAPPVGQGNTP
jgi:hypothetical protein